MPADRPKRTRNRPSVLSPDPTPTPPPLDEETIAILNATTTPYEEPSLTEAKPLVVFSQPDNPDMCELETIENEIDWTVLHPTEGAAKEKKGAATFKRSVMALQKIIVNKLYRVSVASVQTYLKNRFELTRAQAYRFIDCALVLDSLSGLKHPTRERLCRCLKKLCSNKNEMRTVWLKALAERHNDPERVNSALIESLAAEQKQEREGRYIKAQSGAPRSNGSLRKAPTKPSSMSPVPMTGVEGFEDGLIHIKEEGTGTAPPSSEGTPDPFLKQESDEATLVAAEGYEDSLTSSSEEVDSDDSDVYVPKYQSKTVAQRTGTRNGGRLSGRSPALSVEPPKRRNGSVGTTSTSRHGKVVKKGLTNTKREGNGKLPARPGSVKPGINMEEVVRLEGQRAASILLQYSQRGFDLQPRLAQAWRGGITEWRVSTVTNPPSGCIAIDDQGDFMAWEGASEAELERVMQEVVHGTDSNVSDEAALMMTVDASLGLGEVYPHIIMHHNSATAAGGRDMPTSPMSYLGFSSMQNTEYQQVTTGPSQSTQLSIMQQRPQQLQQTSMPPPFSSTPILQQQQQQQQQPLLPTPPPTNAKSSPSRIMEPFLHGEFGIANLSESSSTPGSPHDFLFHLFSTATSDMNSNSCAPHHQSI